MTDIFKPVDVAFMGSCPDMPLEDADAVLFGVPHGTPYEGVDNECYAATADALRLALKPDAELVEHWDFDLGGPLLGCDDFKLTDAGNLATSSLDGAGNRALIKQAVQRILGANAVPIMIGGDDSTPIPFIEALAPKGPLTIVQVDAHIDWRNQRRGETHGFSSTMRRASEFGHVDKIIQIGIRGLGSARAQEVETATNWGAKLITARTLHSGGIETALSHLKKDANCMITFDCDALDPAIMPAVVAPTPGGLSYTQMIDIIAAVNAKANLIAFDLIEFVPQRDFNGTAAITAARVIINVIGNLARNTKK